MSNLSFILPLEKAAPRGGKYISRKKVKGKWVYTYPEEVKKREKAKIAESSYLSSGFDSLLPLDEAKQLSDSVKKEFSARMKEAEHAEERTHTIADLKLIWGGAAKAVDHAITTAKKRGDTALSKKEFLNNWLITGDIARKTNPNLLSRESYKIDTIIDSNTNWASQKEEFFERERGAARIEREERVKTTTEIKSNIDAYLKGLRGKIEGLENVGAINESMAWVAVNNAIYRVIDEDKRLTPGLIPYGLRDREDELSSAIKLRAIKIKDTLLKKSKKITNKTIFASTFQEIYPKAEKDFKNLFGKTEKSLQFVLFKKAAPSGDDDGIGISPTFDIKEWKKRKKDKKMRAKLRFYTEYSNEGVHTRI